MSIADYNGLLVADYELRIWVRISDGSVGFNGLTFLMKMYYTNNGKKSYHSEIIDFYFSFVSICSFFGSFCFPMEFVDSFQNAVFSVQTVFLYISISGKLSKIVVSIWIFIFTSETHNIMLIIISILYLQYFLQLLFRPIQLFSMRTFNLIEIIENNYSTHLFTFIPTAILQLRVFVINFRQQAHAIFNCLKPK